MDTNERMRALIGMDRWLHAGVPALEPGDDVAAIVLDEHCDAEPAVDVPRVIAPPLDVGETVERIVEILSVESEDATTDALRLLVRAFNAIGACFGEWTGRGESRVIAFCGPLARTSDQIDVCRFFIDSYRRREHEPFCATTVVDHDLLYACGALGRRGSDLLTFVMWGAAPARFDDLTPVRVFLRMADGMHHVDRRPPRPSPVAEVVAAADDFPHGHVPGRSRRMRELYRQMRVFAAADFPVLVTGETGVGKEDIVRTMHAWSRRRRGPFVAVNCAAIPDTLLEAEMFGIGRGVASGVTEREGRFRQAAGGTLFLDEIGEMPLSLQAKLLRVLQDNQITPVGAPPVEVDVRTIAATNADLEQKVRAGLFRSDLYYRVTGSVVRVPPLRDRRSDVARLVEHFLRKFSSELDRPIRGISVRTLELLVQHSWPGNIRQLEHEMRRLVYTCPPGRLIDSSQLSDSITAGEPAERRPSSTLDLATRVGELERDLIRQALQRARGNRSEAARLLGLSRNGLALKMQRLEI
jgi:transcriptional regulator with AAA-type ATPase domain